VTGELAAERWEKGSKPQVAPLGWRALVYATGIGWVVLEGKQEAWRGALLNCCEGYGSPWRIDGSHCPAGKMEEFDTWGAWAMRAAEEGR